VPAKADQKPAVAKKSDRPVEKRDANGHFAKGTKPGPGRPPGSPNKFPTHIKEVVQALAAGLLHLEGEKPIQELVIESLIAGIKAPPPQSKGYIELYFHYGIGKPKSQEEMTAGVGRQIPRIVFLSPPHDPLAKPGDPPKAARILGQIDGPNGEIVDAKTKKVVVPAPRTSAPSGNALGEEEDQLELAEDPPSVCLVCSGSGRQRIGFGSRTEPCDECGGTGRMQ